MAEHQFKLSGGQAIIGLIVLVIIFGIRLASFDDQKGNTALMQDLEQHLIAEYFPDDVDRLKAAYESGDMEKTSAVAKSVTSTKLNIRSVKTSFPLFEFTSNKKVIVKVTYSLDNDQGTRKRQTNYYRYQHGAIGNAWQYRGKSSALMYYLNFM